MPPAKETPTGKAVRKFVVATRKPVNQQKWVAGESFIYSASFSEIFLSVSVMDGFSFLRYHVVLRKEVKSHEEY